MPFRPWPSAVWGSLRPRRRSSSPWPVCPPSARHTARSIVCFFIVVIRFNGSLRKWVVTRRGVVISVAHAAYQQLRTLLKFNRPRRGLLVLAFELFLFHTSNDYGNYVLSSAKYKIIMNYDHMKQKIIIILFGYLLAYWYLCSKIINLPTL